MQINFGKDLVIHGFRHAFRDRLRSVQCPSDMIDQIGGWRKKSAGEGYGHGYSQIKCNAILTQIALD